MNNKREMRRVARLYVAELLRADDQPDWPVERGLIDAGDHAGQIEFMEELQRISARSRPKSSPSPPT